MIYIAWILVSFSSSFAAGSCGGLFQSEVPSASEGQVEIAIKVFEGTPVVSTEIESTFKIFKETRKRRPDSPALLETNEVLSLLARPEQRILVRSLREVLSRSVDRGLGEVVEEVLRTRVPADSVKARLTQPLPRLLGEMNLEEASRFFFGASRSSPSPDSVLGRYIAETGAATLMRAFPTRPDSKTLGPERLVIAVSEKSFPKFKKIVLSQPEWFSVFGHANLLHLGQAHHFSGGKSDFNVMSPLHVLPMVLLQTTEAQWLELYMIGVEKYPGWNGDNPVKHPWNLKGYAATGGHSNCTHWIGNIPLGPPVSEYRFPDRSEKPENAQSQVLREYQHDDPLVRAIWTVPGRQQFAELIGQGEANLRGEFANPGWLIHTLLGPTIAERVPAVVLFVADHRAPIDPSFIPQYEAPSQY